MNHYATIFWYIPGAWTFQWPGTVFRAFCSGWPSLPMTYFDQELFFVSFVMVVASLQMMYFDQGLFFVLFAVVSLLALWCVCIFLTNVINKVWRLGQNKFFPSSVRTTTSSEIAFFLWPVFFKMLLVFFFRRNRKTLPSLPQLDLNWHIRKGSFRLKFFIEAVVSKHNELIKGWNWVRKEKWLPL